MTQKIFICLLITYTQNALASEPVNYEDPIEWSIITGEISISVFAMIATHEFGHFAIGEAVGIKTVKFAPYPAKINGVWLLGYNKIEWDTYLAQSKPEKMLYYAGGMIATRSVAEGLDLLMNHTSMHSRAEQALAAAYFVNRFEMTKSILRAAIPCWLNIREGFKHDSQAIVELLSPDREMGRPTTKQKMIYLGATALLIADILIDLDEIENNFDRLWLAGSKKEKSNHDLTISATDSGIFVSVRYDFSI